MEHKRINEVSVDVMNDFLVTAIKSYPKVKEEFSYFNLTDNNIGSCLNNNELFIHNGINYVGDNEFDLNEMNNTTIEVNCEIDYLLNFQGGSYIKVYKKLVDSDDGIIIVFNEEIGGVTVVKF